MQGVIKMFDTLTNEGVLVSDADRAEFVLAAGALDGSIFRMLRQGQRVNFDLDADGRATKHPQWRRARSRAPHRAGLAPRPRYRRRLRRRVDRRSPVKKPTTTSSTTAPMNATNIERKPKRPMPPAPAALKMHAADQAADDADEDRAEAPEPPLEPVIDRANAPATNPTTIQPITPTASPY